MSDTTYLGRKMRRFSSSPQFDGYSKVVITVSDEIEYTAGNELGRTLRLTNPWGTAEMAQDILDSIRGFQYQPYIAENAILDPSVELGDGVTANNVYGGVYTQKITFGPKLRATVSAPEDEEINHEYPYKSKPNKEITREAKMLRASLAIESARITAEVAERKSAVETLTAMLQVQVEKIEAKVSKTGGNPSSFGWELLNSSWTVKGNGREIFKVTQAGADVYGKITATSGKIGGFDILSNYLSYNNQVWDGTNTTGIYLGTSGLQMGKNFKVDASGNLTAASGTFTGAVNAGSIRYGGDYGSFSGSGISGGSIYGDRLVGGTITTAYTNSGINGSLGRADAAYNIATGYTRFGTLVGATLSADDIKLGKSSRTLGTTQITYKDGSDKTKTLNVVTWS